VNTKCSLIIGSTGLIGQELANVLNGEDVYCISRRKPESDNNKNHFYFDISALEKLENLISRLASEYQEIQTYYLAGESSVDMSLKNPRDSLVNSISPFVEFLDIIRNVNSKTIIASSGSVYDARVQTSAFTEKDLVYAPSPYAASKLCLESIAQSFSESFGLDIKIARIFSVYGENMKRFFIYDIIKKILDTDDKVILNGSGKQIRDYLHVSDVAKGMQLILKNGKQGEIYNICSGEPISLNALALKIKNIMQKDFTDIHWNKYASKGQRDIWYGDNSKIKSLGFTYKKLDNEISSVVNSIIKNF
jgi:UDP-glucose 4-epimerase